MYGFLCLPFAGSRRFDGFRTCQRRRHAVKSAEGKYGDYDVKLLRGIDEVDADEWNELVGESGSPFLEHEWIRCMEKSSCASEKSGWYPRHLTAKMDGKLVAAVPLYIKTNSLGEFVFDQSWAEAAYGSGIQYYPKLLCGIPFTPATGRRLLTHPEEDRQELLNFLAYRLLSLTSESNGVSSLHVNFCEDDEVIALKKTGFLHRKGIQYHFVNEDKGRNPLFNSFDEYLGSMKSKRRIKVRTCMNPFKDRSYIFPFNGLLSEGLLPVLGCPNLSNRLNANEEVFMRTLGLL
uniref:Glycylpeptide N-tetradecanoyltransferase n=1 Tax=Rhodosorus marinus TaxID=101924 RepID=A0A7S0BIB7_9RHOD|mmetsp:Transcript_17659/g.25412  ORF Transcript_17659/g.25412 Transcript_17659/m.25412 type:complete len:291 (+) Transcript_17659:228-1100(+)